MELLKFSRKGCVPCMILGNFLADKGVSYKEMDVDNDDDALVLAGLGVSVDSVPILILKDGNSLVNFVVGFNASNPSEVINLLSEM